MALSVGWHQQPAATEYLAYMVLVVHHCVLCIYQRLWPYAL